MDIKTLALLIPIVAMVFGSALWVACAWLILHYKAQTRERQYQLALSLAEKGHPVPPGVFNTPDEPSSDLRRGVVLVMLGIALCIALNEVGTPWTFGLIPAFMGLGYLIVWKFESRKSA